MTRRLVVNVNGIIIWMQTLTGLYRPNWWQLISCTWAV